MAMDISHFQFEIKEWNEISIFSVRNGDDTYDDS